MDAYDEKSANFQETKRHFGTFLADEVRGREEAEQREGKATVGKSASVRQRCSRCCCVCFPCLCAVGGWRVPAARGGHAQEQRGETAQSGPAAAEAAASQRVAIVSRRRAHPPTLRLLLFAVAVPQTRLVVNIDDIRKYDRQMADK